MGEEEQLDIGSIAVAHGLLSAEGLRECREDLGLMRARGLKLSLAEILLSKGYLDREEIARVQKLKSALGGEKKMLGPFEILGKLGEGGMGAVHKVRDTRTGGLAALKILSAPYAQNVEFVQRFKGEARILKALSHPHIVRALDFGELDYGRMRLPYFSMELVEGSTLRERIDAGGAVRETDGIGWMTEIARALQHAYHRELVHRDIKPDNIFITEAGRAKLGDFGLARDVAQEATRITRTGMFMGTVHYSSPEQADGRKDIDIRTDIYSLGATFYHALTGQVPFEGDSAPSILVMHLTEQLPWPGDVNPRVSDSASELICKMMAKKREERFQNPIELLRALDQLESQSGVTRFLRSSAASSIVRSKERRGLVLREQRKRRERLERRRPGTFRVAPVEARPQTGKLLATFVLAVVIGALLVGLAVFLTVGGRRKRRKPSVPRRPMLGPARKREKVESAAAPPARRQEPPDVEKTPLDKASLDEYFARLRAGVEEKGEAEPAGPTPVPPPLPGPPPRRPAALLNAGRAGRIPAGALALTPVADAYVSSRDAGIALGARDRIEAGAGEGQGIRRITYLRFEVEGLPGKVLSAKLRLYCVNASTESGGALFAGEGGWDEAALTFGSRPASKGGPAARLGPVSIGAEYELDVTPLVRGEGTVELVLDSTYEDAAGYGSRESAHPPRLVIVCERPQEEPLPEVAPTVSAEPRKVVASVVSLVRKGKLAEAKHEAASLGGPDGDVLRACVERRERLLKLAASGLLKAGEEKEVSLQFARPTPRGFVVAVEGWEIDVRARKGLCVRADLRTLAMEDAALHCGLDRNSPDGARELGSAWLVDGNAALALSHLSVAKMGGLDVSAEMKLARLLVEPTKKAATGPPKKRVSRRVTNGLIAYYSFIEGKGTVVNDRSGVGAPLDLRIAGRGVTWLRGRNGIRIESQSTVKSPGAAAKICKGVLGRGQFTLEVWCRPASASQTGPARIVSYSKDSMHRNLTLGQSGKKIIVRLRTTSTNLNGTPSMNSGDIVTTDETHYVVTCTAGRAERLYRNGVVKASASRADDMSNWDASYPFMVGNEATNDRPWLGEVYLVAVYERALRPEEVLRNYKAGSSPHAGLPAEPSGAVLEPDK